MEKAISIICVSVILIFGLFISCKKEKSSPSAASNTPTTTTPTANNRVIKYEITGSYTGTLTIAYTNQSGGTESVVTSNIPWVKEITFPNSVSGIGIGGNGIGTPSQTVSLKIYSAGNVVKIGTATADANGIISLPSLAYVF